MQMQEFASHVNAPWAFARQGLKADEFTNEYRSQSERAAKDFLTPEVRE